MNLFKFNKIAFTTFLLAVVFLGCKDDDDNGNIIEVASCTDQIQNGDETGVDCGGSCAPCIDGLDFTGTYLQEDSMGRPGINTVFGGTDAVKNAFNTTQVSKRTNQDTIPNTQLVFQEVFLNTLEGYHDVYALALGIPVEDLDYETNILGLDASTFTTVLAQFDALQVAPNGPTTYFDGTTALTGRRLSDDVIDISLTLMFGGTTGTRFDGNNGTPQLTSDGVGPGDRNFSLPFPYLEAPNQL